MNSVPAVVFDLDDVLVNLREQVYRMFLKEKGSHIPKIEDWWTYRIPDLFNLEEGENPLELIQEYKCLENARPETYAIELVKRYFYSGHRIFVVTSRAWHPHGYNLTEQWLDDYNLIEYIDNFYLTGMGECKSHVIERLVEDGYEIKRFYEDHIDNIIPCVEKGLIDDCGVLVDRPWNREGQEKYSHLFETGDIKLFKGVVQL